MKKVISCLIFCALMLFLTTASYASLNQFAGYWKNSDSNTGGVTKLKIQVLRTNTSVQAWGKCYPGDCDWGTVKGYAYAPDVSSNLVTSAKAITTVFRKSFKLTRMVIQPYGNNRLKVSVYTHFTDNSNRTDYCNQYIFNRLFTRAPVRRTARDHRKPIVRDHRKH